MDSLVLEYYLDPITLSPKLTQPLYVEHTDLSVLFLINNHLSQIAPTFHNHHPVSVTLFFNFQYPRYPAQEKNGHQDIILVSHYASIHI